MCKKLIWIFLAVMLGLMVLSRFLDTVIVPQITVEMPKKAVLQYQTKGCGILEAEETLSVTILEGISVSKVLAGIGQEVTTETPLFAYQMDELEKYYDQQNRELEQLKLSLESEALAAEALPKMSAEELALQELARKQTQLGRAQEKLGRAETEYQTETIKLEKEFTEDLEKNKEDLTKEREEAYLEAEQEYELAILNKRMEMRTARWEYDNAVRKLEQLEDEDAPSSEIWDAELEVDRTFENKDIVEMKWIFEVDKAKLKKEKAYDSWHALLYGQEDIETSLRKEYEQNLKDKKTEFEAVQDQLTAAADDYQQAATELENARKNDQYDKIGAARTVELSELKQQSMEMDIEAKVLETERLKTLIDQGGIVYAPYPGILTKLDVAGEDGLVQIGSGGILMKAEVDGSFILERNICFSVSGISVSVRIHSGKMVGFSVLD